jgi:uncharacterized membrane protein
MSTNDMFYEETIVKITSVETNFSHEELVNETSSERYYDQMLTGIITNGSQKGSLIQLENTYSSSGVYDEKYHVSDKVFITLDQTSHTGTILQLKRDIFFVVPFTILLLAIFLVIRKKGFFTILSLMVNIALFWYALALYRDGVNLLFISRLMMILFTIFSLVIVSGFHKKTVASILSTLTTILFISILFHIVMRFSPIDYSYMDYIVNPNDLHIIFQSQLLIGGLGAIMDISISMSSLIQELVEQNPIIEVRDLWKSGRELGYDIMGTMINVMLFTFICGSIPSILLKMDLQYKLLTIITLHMPLELYRFFLGSIGIIIAIPISLMLSIVFLKKRRL